MNKTGVPYADYSWNWATGCTKVSPGCKNCYMYRIYERFKHQDPSKVILHPERLSEPLYVKKPSRIFVNDMGDSFHSDVPDEYIDMAFDIMYQTPQHTYLLLTKRIERMKLYSETHRWPDNVWAGVSVESQKYATRLDMLAKVTAKVRFVSCEPLLGPLDLKPYFYSCGCEYTPCICKGLALQWVIVGGESGPNFRPMDLDWARCIRDDCIAQGVAYYYKQGSGIRPGMNRELDGKIWSEMPKEA